MKKSNVRQFIPYIVLSLVVVAVIFTYGINTKNWKELSYSELINELSQGNVSEIVTEEHTSDGVYYITGKLASYEKNDYFKVYAPLSENVQEELTAYYQNKEFKWEVSTNP